MRWNLVLLGIFLSSLGFVSATIPDTCDASMVAYWQFEDNTQDSYSGNHGSGSIGGAFTDAVVGKAVDLDGSKKIEVDGTSSGLQLTAGSTISFWFKGDNINPASGEIIEKSGAYDIDYEYTPGFPTTSKIKATYNGVIVETDNLDFGDTYFISVVYNVSVLRIYWNDSPTTIVSNIALTSEALPPTGSDVIIGEGFVGLLDEMAVFDREFQDYEVKANFITSGDGLDYCHSAGSGQVSGTETNFSINGCSLPDGGGISVGTCSRDEMYYCRGVGDLMDTLTDYFACSKGDNVIGADESPCCPAGYECKKQGNGNYLCEYSGVQCSTLDDEVACKAAQCFWIEGTSGEGICSSTSGDYSCSFYDGTSEAICEDDLWNLGRTGAGTDVCGTSFIDRVSGLVYVVPLDSCRCEWDSGQCYFLHDIVPDIRKTQGEDQFTCQKHYDMGKCGEPVEGEQKVSWTSSITGAPGQFQIDSAERTRIADLIGCTASGESTRSCGDSLVKVPFFSSYSLIAAICCLGIFYFFRKQSIKS